MKRHNSKISVGLILILAVALVLPLVATIYTHDWFTSAILLATIVFVLHLFLRTYYVIENGKLYAKAGLLYTIEVDIHRIKRIEKSNSLLSSPALSLDRIEITYNKFDSVLVSPKDKEAFIADLLAVNPDIIVKL